MIIKTKFLMTLTLLTGLLMSCGQPSGPVRNLGEVKTYHQDELTMTYEKFMGHNKFGLTPAFGDVNLIVIPVNFESLKPSFEFNDETVKNLDALFNGTKQDHSNDYWESLKSYYYKSSYGQLNFNCDIADPLTPSLDAPQFRRMEKLKAGKGCESILNDVLKTGTIDGKPIDFRNKKYDANNDGTCDGIWLVYNEIDVEKEYDYWPYQFYYDKSAYPLEGESPIHMYANMGYAFAYDDGGNGLNAHSVCHETGHMLGLDDYYSYDSDVYGDTFPSSLGGVAMMDTSTSGDQDAFSKLGLGWIDAKIVNGEGEFVLRPLDEVGDALIIGDPATFNGSAFDEYLILQYYRPKNLNEFDGTKEIIYDWYPNQFHQSGLMVLHIDARLLELALDESGHIIDRKYYEGKGEIKDHTFYKVAHTNTLSKNALNEKDEALISLIPADNKILYYERYANDDCLFKVGDSFDIKTYGQFFKGNAFNNGYQLNYQFQVTEMSDEELVINVTTME